ncbi:MAG: DNA polymerase III subunit beta [Holosporales bacterium]|jgi:DNA polymerase-3 subunit beta
MTAVAAPFFDTTAPEGDAFQVTLERAVLFKALAHVQSAVERRNTVEILSNVLITVDAAALRLVATDLEMDVQETVAVLGGQPGASTAPAQMLFDLIRKLPDGATVTLTAQGGQLKVTAGRERNYQLPTLPASQFPVLSLGDFPHSFKIAARDLRRLLDKTRFAMSADAMRYYLNGVYLHVADRKLCAATTDAHRLAYAEIPVPEGAEAIPGIILPRKMVNEVVKILADHDDAEVLVQLSTAKIRLQVGGVVVTSKLIDGTFPDYNRVIPKNNAHVFTVPVKPLATAVDRIVTLTADKDKIKAVGCHLSDGMLRLSIGGLNVPGQGKEEIPADYQGEALSLGFNAPYLLDVLNQIDGPQVSLAAQDSMAAVLVRDVSATDTLFVLMPIRV